MFPEIKFKYSCTRIYRQSLILKVLFLLMILVDIVSLFFAPLWVLVLFLIIHVVLVALWIRTKLQLFDAFVSDLLE